MVRTNLVKARGNKSQTEIAVQCGVSQQTYSHWERGRATPSIKKMILLEHIFGVPKEILFFDIFNSYDELKRNTKNPQAS